MDFEEHEGKSYAKTKVTMEEKPPQYVVDVLQYSSCKSFLPLFCIREEWIDSWYHEVTGKKDFLAFLKDKKTKETTELRLTVIGLRLMVEAIMEGERYLISPSQYQLSPGLVYFDEKSSRVNILFFFDVQKKNLPEKMELFVKELNIEKQGMLNLIQKQFENLRDKNYSSGMYLSILENWERELT